MVTTPGLEFAHEQKYEPAVLEAWTWAERARVLDPSYQRVRDARAARTSTTSTRRSRATRRGTIR